MGRRVLLSLLLVIGAVILITATGALADRMEDTFYVPPDHPAIQYAGRAPDDAVARLDKQLESGRVKLDFAPNGLGYLPSALKELGMNIDSQVLVFSKSSTQNTKINPRTPRAIYFNDDVTAGFVQGGDLLEFTALDPRKGVVLYTLDSAKSSQPGSGRRDDCLRCNQGAATLGMPGLLVSSVRPSSDQARDMHGSSFITDHRSPFNERWGGWYVTGTHGSQYHLGNNVNLVDPIHPGGPMRQGTQNVTSLDDKFDTSKYLAPTSDLVALLTLEHQTRMINLMTRIGWDARIAVHDNKLDSAQRELINAEIDEMVRYMLFADEEPLREPVAGVSTFTKTFPQRGPRDRQGRSLRDFDLNTRLFRHPLSYMIYSAAFDGMPDLVRDRLYQRLYEVLTGKDGTQAFARLSAADRRAILEIVGETKRNLPAYWTAASPQAPK
jgi:hypothetical protein